jgi:hypothetical protein
VERRAAAVGARVNVGALVEEEDGYGQVVAFCGEV